MTIPFEKLKARLLADPKVKAEYNALAMEFEITAGLLRKTKPGRRRQPPKTTRRANQQNPVKPLS